MALVIALLETGLICTSWQMLALRLV